jgi:hypothetical protein
LAAQGLHLGQAQKVLRHIPPRPRRLRMR